MHPNRNPGSTSWAAFLEMGERLENSPTFPFSISRLTAYYMCK